MIKEIEIPEGYEARIEGNKVIIEQKESEDERIRKEIIEYFKHYSGGDNISVKFPKWIAYLENQKDAIGTAKQQGYEKGMEDGIKMNMERWMEQSKEWADKLDVEINRISKQYPEVSFAKLCRIAVHFVRWQKDQKPAEWTKEDEEWMGYFERLLEYGYNHDPRGFGRCCIAGKMWLKSFHHQPKQEWSDEDKEIMDSLIKYHYDQGEISSKHNKWASWLVSFSPQLQMVYKTTIESILKLCNSCDLNKQFGAKAMDFWGNVKLKCEDALKSRKLLNIVYWKPKEEQIEALNQVIENHSSLLRKDDILSPIIELCTDLEKL